MVMPFLVLYMTSELNVTPGSAGFVLTFYGIGALIAGPFAGKLSDKIGAMTLMKLSLIFSGIFLFIYSLVTDYIILLILTLVWASIAEGFRPASLSYISDQIEVNRRKTAFALNRLAINLGMSIGPVVGGILSTIDFSLLFYIDGITSVAAGIFLILTRWDTVKIENEDRKEIKEEQTPAPKIFKDIRFVYFLLAFIPVQIIFFQYIGAMSLYLVNELGYAASTFGALIAVNTVLIIFVEVPLNDAMSGWANWKSLALGALLSGIGFGTLAFAHDIGSIIIAIVIWTFGEMILFPAGAAYVAEISPESKRGEYMGYFMMTFSLSFTIGPWLGTEVYEYSGPVILWSGVFVLGLISMFLLMRLKKYDHT